MSRDLLRAVVAVKHRKRSLLRYEIRVLFDVDFINYESDYTICWLAIIVVGHGVIEIFLSNKPRRRRLISTKIEDQYRLDKGRETTKYYDD